MRLIHLHLDKAGPNTYVLSKSVNFGQSWKTLLTRVRKVWSPELILSNAEMEAVDEENVRYLPPGRFLYASHFVDAEMKTLRLSMSEDAGSTFRKVYLPTVVPEQARYSPSFVFSFAESV